MSWAVRGVAIRWGVQQHKFYWEDSESGACVCLSLIELRDAKAGPTLAWVIAVDHPNHLGALEMPRIILEDFQ